MAEYIDREAALNVVDFWASSREQNIQLTTAVNAIPSADVIEVVRCKDCRYSYEEPYSMGISHRVCAYGVYVDCEVEDDFYCAFGVKTDESEGEE